MDIIQNFYDSLAPEYDKLFSDWIAATKEQASILQRLFTENGFDGTARILDCACGIGTQAVGLAALGYDVTASDISEGALIEARKRAEDNGVGIDFHRADFRSLSDVFSERFDIIIAMDNALPHMLSAQALKAAIGSIVERMRNGGLFIASIRDYDSLLEKKPPYSAPYVYKAENGRHISFQTWDWSGDIYRLKQYIIDDGEALTVSTYECEYRATRRTELTDLLKSAGCDSVEWKFPEQTGFYQPIVIAAKRPQIRRI